MQILQKRATKAAKRARQQKPQAILTLLAALTLLSLLTRGGVERNPGPSTQEIMDRIWRNEQAIDSVVREQSKALERERILAEEVNFLKDEVDRLELVLRKDNLKFLGIPETAQESYEACVQKVVDVLNNAGELAIPFTASDIQQAYRINGRRRRNEPRPLIVKFTHRCDKLGILMNKEIRDQLRHNGVRVANDLTRRQSSQLAEIRRQGKVGYFLNGKLRVAERQSRISENDNDSRYALHDRQSNSRAQHWKDYQHHGSSDRAHNAPPRNRGPTNHYHHRHRAEDTVDYAEAFQAAGGAPSDNKQRGCSHYSAECSASKNNARQRNTVADSRTEQFEASTERDDASRRGEDECETRHRTGHGDCVVNDELNSSVYIYNIDSFPLVNNSHNGDLHLPGTAFLDVTDGQADAATHDRSVDCQYEPVSSTDSLLRELSSDILGQDIENIPVITPAQDSPPDLDQVSMVTWGTAFEDPQMMDDDVSPQDNNDATPEVPPTTSETQQPYNQAATARQTPLLVPSSEMTSQQPHDVETYAAAALSGDTAYGLMCSHRAAHKTENSSCVLTSHSLSKDIASESTGRSFAPGLPDNARTNEAPPETAPAPETPPAPAAVTDTSTQTTASPRKLQDVAPRQLLDRTTQESPPADPGSASLPDQTEGNRGTTQADDGTSRPTVHGVAAISPGDRHYSHVIADTQTPHTDTRTRPVTSDTTLTPWRLSLVSPRVTRQSSNARCLKSSTIDTWLAKLPTQTRTTSVADRRAMTTKQKGGKNKNSGK